jgi:O-antigen/teichoic acid export membrane protein
LAQYFLSLRLKINGIAIAKLLHFIIGVATLALLARCLDSVEFGLYIYFTSTVQIFAVFLLFGYQRESTRITAKWISKNSPYKIWTTLYPIPFMLFAGVLGLWCILSFGFFAGFLSSSPPEEIYPVVLCAIFARGVGIFICGMLRGTPGVTRASFLEHTSVSALTLIFFILFYIFSQLTLTHALASYGLASAISASLAFRSLEKFAPVTHVGRKNPFTPESLNLWLFDVLVLSQTYVQVYLLSTYEIAEVALFGAVYRMASYVSAPLSIVNEASSSQMASLIYAGSRERLQQVVRLSSVFAGLPSLFILVFLSLLAEHIMNFVFGESFTGGGMGLTIVLIGSMISVLTGSHGTLLAMAGKGSVLALSLAASVIVGSTVTYFFMHDHGYLAGCLGLMLCTGLNNFFSWLYCRSILGVETGMSYHGIKLLVDQVKTHRISRQ